MKNNKLVIEKQLVNKKGLIIFTILTIIFVMIAIIVFINNIKTGSKLIIMSIFPVMIVIHGWKTLKSYNSENIKTKYVILNSIENDFYEFIDENGDIRHIACDSSVTFQIENIYKITEVYDKTIIEEINDNEMTEYLRNKLNNQLKTKEEIIINNEIKEKIETEKKVSIYNIFMTIAYMIIGITITIIILSKLPKQNYNYDVVNYAKILVLFFSK